MPGIQITGLASGLDTATIISQLMAIERLPRTKIEYSQSQVEARRSGLSNIQSKLDALKRAVRDLSSVAVWQDTQSVESSDAGKVVAKRTGGAAPGGYELVVDQLAAAARRTYQFDSSDPLTITIRDSGGNETATFEVEAGTSLDDLVARINATPSSGVYAVNVGGQLVLSARTTGEASNFTVDGLGPAVESVDGRDAIFSINGQQHTSSSNVVSDAIPGLELTLKARTDGTTITVGPPAPDTGLIKEQIKAFVDAYNAALTAMTDALSEKKVANPSNKTDAAKGALFGDSGVREILSTLRTAVGSVVPGFDESTTGSGLMMLAQIGISTGAASSTVNNDSVSGRLVFDEAAFDAAFAKDPLGVQRLLGGMADTPGFAQDFVSRLDVYVGSEGVLSQRMSAIDGELTRIRDSLTRFDERLAMREERYQRQFAALESALSRSQALSNQLAAQLNSLMSTSNR